MSPLGERVKLGGEVIRESALELLSVHLRANPGNLPGHLTVLSMLVVGGNVGDDLNANRSVRTITGHPLPPPQARLTRSEQILYPRTGKRKGYQDLRGTIPRVPAGEA